MLSILNLSVGKCLIKGFQFACFFDISLLNLRLLKEVQLHIECGACTFSNNLYAEFISFYTVNITKT